MPKLLKTPEQRFWDRVAKSDGCWIWTGKLHKGRGRLCVNNKNIPAHRLSWEIEHKVEIPSGFCVCHTCDNPQCVRPDHLFLGTQADNIRDMYEKGRGHLMPPPPASGENNPNAKLTKERVLLIVDYLRRGEKCRSIAEKFGCDPSTIASIGRGDGWSSVTGINRSPTNAAE